MRKLFITVISGLVAIAYSLLPTIGYADDAADFSNIPIIKALSYEPKYFINQDDVRVWIRHAGEYSCIVNSGTKVKVDDYQPRGIRHVTVRSGPQNRKCSGWVSADEVSQLPHVFNIGKWGKYVPVFKTQKDYFNARDRDNFNNMVCQLEKGAVLDYAKPYRDWGLTEIRKGECQGWTDRGMIR